MTATKSPSNVKPMGIWDVQGTFIIPGTREKVSFGPHRVVGPNKTIASAGLVGLLNETFSKELQNMPRVAFQHVGFSKGFALMHLSWTVFVPKVEKPKDVKEIAVEAMAAECNEALVAIPQEDRNDPPAVETT